MVHAVDGLLAAFETHAIVAIGEQQYVQLYSTLRAINQTLPEGERIRVLLGDPPIDWSTVKPVWVKPRAR